MLRFVTLCFCLAFGHTDCWAGRGLAENARSARIEALQMPRLKMELTRREFRLGAPIFIRLFKESAELEVWLERAGKFERFRTYPVCAFSGNLGPKLAQGDLQSPEGFYFVGPRQMNPWSRFHLSFNLGFPNAYDRHHGRTGSHLMVHGDCVSIGCYAMTDAIIEEIYTLASAALRQGQPFFRVHVFPFRMDAMRMAAADQSQWLDFWRNLKEGYDWFERSGRPPDVRVQRGRYVFRSD